MFNKKLYTVIIIIYVIAGIIGGTYVTLTNVPKLQGYVLFNWSSTYFLKLVNVTRKGPLLVVSQDSKTFLYEYNKWYVVDFETEAACSNKDNKIVLAGSSEGRPSILVVNLNNNSAYDIIFEGEGSINVLSCGGNIIAGGGSFPRPFLIVYNLSDFSSRIYTFLNTSLNYIKKIKVVNNNVFMIVKDFSGKYYLFLLSENNLKNMFLAYPRNITLIDVFSREGNVLIDGYYVKNNTDTGFLETLNNSTTLFELLNGKGIEILSATFYRNGTAHFYIRSPLGFWDGLAVFRNNKVWFSRILLPYTHVVTYSKMDPLGKALVAAILYTEKGNVLVIVRGFSLRPVVLWADDHPYFYIKKPLLGQKIVVINKRNFFGKNVKICYNVKELKYFEKTLNLLPTSNMPQPVKLTTKINKTMILSLNALYGIVFAVLIYEGFRPRTNSS